MQIELNTNGKLCVRAGGGERERESEFELPPGQAEEMLVRLLAMQARARARAQAQPPSWARFYAMHLERHAGKPQPQCQWCQEEALAEEVLRHPITRVELSARTMAKPEIGEELAEELGF